MSKFGAIFASMSLGSGPVRTAIKDCIDIAGYPTVGGSAALALGDCATQSAAVVQALLDSGCQIVGKTNMHEIAYGVTGINHWTGSPRNPRFPDRVPGGSSSGSAVAVAEGLVDFAIGTDTGGSIRTPAACCGVFGLKPTFGRVSREGAWPRFSTLDCIGPLARSLDAIEQAMMMIAPEFTPRKNEKIRFAVVRIEGVDAPVQAAFDNAVATFAGSAPQVRLPGLSEAYSASLCVIGHETFVAFGHLLGSNHLGEDVKARLAAAALIDAKCLTDAEIVRQQFRAEVDAALRDHDVIVMPTMPCFPISLADSADAAAALRMTALVRPFNLSGHPALSVPLIAPEGLPVGIQIVGRRGEDDVVCAFGRAIERSIDMIDFPSGEDLSR